MLGPPKTGVFLREAFLGGGIGGRRLHRVVFAHARQNKAQAILSRSPRPVDHIPLFC
jgi:hypothetical protein